MNFITQEVETEVKMEVAEVLFQQQQNVVSGDTNLMDCKPEILTDLAFQGKKHVDHISKASFKE